MKQYTGEKQKSFYIPLHSEQVFLGIHYYNGMRLRFVLMSFKKAGASFVKEGDDWLMIEPIGNKYTALLKKLERLYRHKIIEAERKQDEKQERLKKKKVKESVLHIKDAMNSWIKASKTDRSQETLDKFYKPMKERYLATVGNHLLNNISDAQIQKFRDSLSVRQDTRKQAETSNTYRNIHIRQLRVFLKWAYKTKNSKGQRYLTDIPEVPLFKAEKKLPDLYSDDEMRRLMDHLDGLLTDSVPDKKPNKRQKRFILLHNRFLYLLLGTGFRRSEAAFLEWDQIDFDDGLITVRSKPEYKFKIKEGQETMRPVLPDALAYLKEQRELYPDEKFVLDSNKKPAFLNPHAISTAFQRYKKELGLNPKAKAVHSIRAFFASLAEHNGVGVETIRLMMGHSSTETTRIYLGRPTERIRNAMKVMDKGAKKIFRK